MPSVGERQRLLPLVEVPLLNQNIDATWRILDFSDGFHVESNAEFRNNIASCMKLNVGSSAFHLFWRVTVNGANECLELSVLDFESGVEGGNTRIFFAEPLVSAECYQIAETNDVMLLVVSSKGIRCSLLPVSIDGNEILSFARAETSLNRHLDEFYLRDGITARCADFAFEEQSISILLGTSGGTVVRGNLFYDGTVAMQSELSATSYSWNLFRNSSKLASPVCSVVHSLDADTSFSLSEDGSLRRWEAGKCRFERVVKLEKSVGGIKNSFIAKSMQIVETEGVEEARLVFSLASEHSLTSLMAWTNLDDFSLNESVQSEVSRLVSERLQELGDEAHRQNLSYMRRFDDSGRSLLLSVWDGENGAQALLVSRFHSSGCEHRLVHSVSMEMTTEIQVARLHLEALLLGPLAVHLAPLKLAKNALDHSRSLLFRPGWFRPSAMLEAADALLAGRGLAPDAWPDARCPADVRAFLSKTVEKLAKQSMQDGSGAEVDQSVRVIGEAWVWSEAAERCQLAWRQADACIGVAPVHVGGRVMPALLKRGGLTLLRPAETAEADLHSPAPLGAPSRSLAAALALGALVWAEEVDPGGQAFGGVLAERGAAWALEWLRDLMLPCLSQLPDACDPEACLRDAAAARPLHESLMVLLDDGCGLARRLLDQDMGPEGGLGRAATEYGAAQQLRAYTELLRGLGLYLALLTHFGAAAASPASAGLAEDLRRCAALLGLLQALRWATTQAGPVHSSRTWVLDRSLLSLALGAVDETERPEAPEDGLGDSAMEGGLEHNGDLDSELALAGRHVVLSVLRQLVLGRHVGREATDMWQGLDRLVTYLAPDAGSGGGAVWAGLARSLCSVELGRAEAAEMQMQATVQAGWRGAAERADLADLADRWLGGRDPAWANLRTEIPEAAAAAAEAAGFGGGGCAELGALVELLVGLHDPRGGLFRALAASLDHAGFKLGGAGLRLRQLELESLARIRAQAGMYRGLGTWVAVDAVAVLAAGAHEAALVQAVRAILALASRDGGAGRRGASEWWDRGYELMADRIAACGDEPLDRLQARWVALPADDVAALTAWLKETGLGRMDGGPASESLRTQVMERRVATGVQLLRLLLGGMQAARQLDRVCDYPWVGCGRTVDSWLAQLSRLGLAAQAHQAFLARYSLAVQRSDYAGAAAAMWHQALYLARPPPDAPASRRLPLAILRRQAQACLAAIQALSLVDPVHAVLRLDLPAPARHAPKRAGDGVGAASSAKLARAGDGAWLGWQVRAAQAGGLEEVDVGEEAGDGGGESASDELVTLDQLRRHYALLRFQTTTNGLDDSSSVGDDSSMPREACKLVSHGEVV